MPPFLLLIKSSKYFGVSEVFFLVLLFFLAKQTNVSMNK